jgi:DNA polymerase-3 subunit delta
LRQLDQELEKLLAHAGFERPVTIGDVQDLVHATQTSNVFALVDAIGLRRRKQAVRHLHELLDSGAAPLYLLTMIERQFRILLQVKELRDQGASSAQMMSSLGIRHAFIIEKSLRQAQNYSMSRLESIYTHLADVEQSIKTGNVEALLALDVLVVELSA